MLLSAVSAPIGASRASNGPAHTALLAAIRVTLTAGKVELIPAVLVSPDGSSTSLTTAGGGSSTALRTAGGGSSAPASEQAGVPINVGGRAELAAAAEEGSRVEAALDAADANIRLRAKVTCLMLSFESKERFSVAAFMAET